MWSSFLIKKFREAEVRSGDRQRCSTMNSFNTSFSSVSEAVINDWKLAESKEKDQLMIN